MIRRFMKGARSVVWVLVGKSSYDVLAAEVRPGSARLLRRDSKPRASGTACQAALGLDPRPDEVVLLLGREHVTVRVLDLPTTDAQEIRDIVHIQAAKQTPFARDQIYHDHVCLGASPQGYTKVFLAIAQRDKVDECCKDFTDKGIPVSGVRLDTEGLLAWAEPARRGGAPQALIVQGPGGCEWVVVDSSRLVFTRFLHVPEGHPGDASWDERFGQEVALAAEAYQSEMGGPLVRRALALGPADFRRAACRTLARAGWTAAEETGWPPGVELARSFPSADAEGTGVPAKISGSVSLRARGGHQLDLSPPALKAAADVRRVKSLLGSAAWLACLLLAAFSVLSLESRASDAWRFRKLSEKEKVLAVSAASLEEMDRRLAVIREAELPAASPLTAIRDAVAAAPEGVLLTSLDCRPGERLLLQGAAPTDQAVHAYRARLSASAAVASARVAFAAPRPSGGPGAVDFELECLLRTPAQTHERPASAAGTGPGAGGVRDRLVLKASRVRYLETLLARKDRLEEEIRKYDRHLNAPAATDPAEWALLENEIRAVAGQQRLTVQDVRRAGVTSDGRLRMRRMAVDTQGGMLDLLRACRLLETSRALLRVDRFSIVSLPAQRGAYRASLEVSKLQP